MLVRRTDGSAGNATAAICNHAGTLAVREAVHSHEDVDGTVTVEMRHFQEALGDHEEFTEESRRMPRGLTLRQFTSWNDLNLMSSPA